MTNLFRNKYSILFLTAFFLLLVTSCNNRPKGVLSQGDMTEFLTDLHELDGMLLTQRLGSIEDRENIYYYNSLLKKYNITKDNFDSSLVWYNQHPKKFEKIYATVIDNLNEKDSLIKLMIKRDQDSLNYVLNTLNIWEKSSHFKLTKDSARTQLYFEIKNPQLLSQDNYILKLHRRIAREDSCSTPFITLRVHYSNGTVDSVYTLTQNDNSLYKYSLFYGVRKKLRIDYLSVSLLGSKEYKGKQNAQLDSISLIREYIPALQDSINTILNNIDSINKLVPEIIDTIYIGKRLRNSVITQKAPKKPLD